MVFAESSFEVQQEPQIARHAVQFANNHFVKQVHLGIGEQSLQRRSLVVFAGIARIDVTVDYGSILHLTVSGKLSVLEIRRCALCRLLLRGQSGVGGHSNLIVLLLIRYVKITLVFDNGIAENVSELLGRLFDNAGVRDDMMTRRLLCLTAWCSAKSIEESVLPPPVGTVKV